MSTPTTDLTTEEKLDPARYKTAEEMAMAMLTVPMWALPPLATGFLKSMQTFMNIETCITAYSVYAQCVHKLPCSDDLYLARPQDIEWFRVATTPA